MQNGIYKEGWLEFSNRFSMNLTKVLFVTFIFLFALSFAAGTAGTETAGTETAGTETAECSKHAATAEKGTLIVTLQSKTKFQVTSNAAKGQATAKQADTHLIRSVSQLLIAVLYSVFLLYTCFGFVWVYPMSSSMVWIMIKLPRLCFEVPQEASEDIKKDIYTRSLNGFMFLIKAIC